MTLDEYLADLSEKAEKATPGPWVHCFGTYTKDTLVRTDTGFDHTYIANVRPRENGYQDAAHIAAFSPDTCAALVQCAASLRALVSDRHGHSPGCSCPWCVARMNLSRLTALARTR